MHQSSGRNEATSAAPSQATLPQLLRFFLLLGCTAFGGPVAHLAIMEREAVQRRGWMTREEFVDMMGILNLIPGPNSTQMVMYFGYRHGRIGGMLVAGLGFILPAALITVALAWAYLTYGSLPEGQAVLFGVQPVVVAVIASAMWRFLPQGVKGWQTGLIFILAIVAAFMDVHEVVIILTAGAVGWVWFSGWRPRLPGAMGMVPVAILPGTAAAPLLQGEPAAGSLTQLFAVFAKIALVLYGTGYLLVAYMQGELVDLQGWLSNQQLLDVIAIGQMTPGPFLTTATAAGMLIAGWPGALVGTVAIFLPSFILLGILGPRIDRLRASRGARHVLTGINAAVVAVLLAVSITFAAEVATHWTRVVVVLLALLALERGRVSAMLLVALGAAYGLIWQFLG